jgi:hypothetical protein
VPWCRRRCRHMPLPSGSRSHLLDFPTPAPEVQDRGSWGGAGVNGFPMGGNSMQRHRGERAILPPAPRGLSDCRSGSEGWFPGYQPTLGEFTPRVDASDARGRTRTWYAECARANRRNAAIRTAGGLAEEGEYPCFDALTRSGIGWGVRIRKRGVDGSPRAAIRVGIEGLEEQRFAGCQCGVPVPAMIGIVRHEL